MKSSYLLQALHRQTAAGASVGVADSFRGETIRLVYQTRPDGVISGWQVESAELPTPATFKTEYQARAFIRNRWMIDPCTRRY